MRVDDTHDIASGSSGQIRPQAAAIAADTEPRGGAQQDAEAHAAQLATFFDTMADGAILFDQEGRVIQVNGAFSSLLGLDARPDFFSLPLTERLRLINYRDERDQPVVEEQWLPRRVLTGEVLTGAKTLDMKATSLDGRHLVVNASGAPVRNAAGEIIGGVLIMRDVSQRRDMERAAQDAAREAQARASQLEVILETMADGVLVFDREGHILRTNAADTDLLRLSLLPEGPPQTLHERGQMLDLRDEAGHPLAEEQWAASRVLRGETLRSADALDMTFRGLDGRDILVNVTGAPIRDATGNINGGVVILRDVTARRRLEHQTHGALTALLAMAEILVSDPDRTAEDANAMAAMVQRLTDLTQAVLGCQRATMVPVGPEDEVRETWGTAGAIPDEERRQWQANWPRAGQRYLHHFLPAEFIAQLHSGELLLGDRLLPPLNRWPNPLAWRSVLMVPMLLGRQLVGILTLDYGPVVHVCTVDEMTLARGVARLAVVVLERDRLLREREIERAKALALAEANRRMDEFLGIATHELKTPVTSSSLSVGLAALYARDLLARITLHDAGLATQVEAIQGLTGRAEESMERLSRLIADLLDVSRIRAGRLEFRLGRCDLATIVRDAVAEQRQLVPGRVIHLRLAAAAEAPVIADADRLRQVVTNYLNNALKYSPADQPVDVRLQVREKTVRVSVRDQGPGLPVNEQERVWERFQRVEGIEVLSGTGVGLGLGLHICKTIIERHTGQFGVRSAPGKGATFWFSLPLESSGG